MWYFYEKFRCSTNDSNHFNIKHGEIQSKGLKNNTFNLIKNHHNLALFKHFRSSCCQQANVPLFFSVIFPFLQGISLIWIRVKTTILQKITGGGSQEERRQEVTV